MAVPVFVQAGAGVAILTGTGTVSLAGCEAGNLILFHLVARGLTEDWSFPTFASEVNIENLAGTDNALESHKTFAEVGATSTTAIFVCRVMADGTISADATVGASGQDLFLRAFEFSGVSLGTTRATVFEGDNVPGWSEMAGTSATVADAGLTTLGADRLALQFVGIDANRTIGAFTGETGGDWTEAVAEYAPATGATATLQLQSASMPTAGTIDGGTVTITSSGWGVIGTALIPASITGTGRRTFKRFFGPALLTAAAADLYTVPSAKRAIIRHIHVSNPTASPVDLTLSIGTDAASTRIYDDRPVSADGILQEYRDYTLAAGEKVQGFASTTGVLNLTIDGYEEAL